jgi:2,4-dienoyl-CoA reductase-like NADH-dependent reductase (Old Yellow Enzyme family)/2-polyprenyl-6-methoxyphenol hydroxylase-like FAD-dependent oxidoreductase
VKISIVGAGPAGLYLGVLLKKADPGVDVRVIERNAPDATFGWGVVFSEETLGALRDADPETYFDITDTFARWDRVDVRYRDRVLRSRGHSFSAIARKRLLEILQQRCRSLGVELEFGVEVDEMPRGGDLVVGADGVNSIVRRAHEEDFGSSVEPEGCKYVWFGTDLVFDAFTFIFRETEHGLFQVHAYPFDEHLSTFIVECPEPTWRRAGLDTMDEDESLAFCERLFARDLEGRELLSNRSIWLDFPKVTNKAWHHRRIVLVGDAAHTAHFSIGSGTKLAMEDAVALRDALVRRAWDVEASLVDYELERQPVVERTQQAASESAAYFGRVASYAHMEPLQFAFNLLTRSGRITHARLAVRDPAFTRALDSWFAPREAVVAPPPMLAPLSLGARRSLASPDPTGSDPGTSWGDMPSERERLSPGDTTGPDPGTPAADKSPERERSSLRVTSGSDPSTSTPQPDTTRVRKNLSPRDTTVPGPGTSWGDTPSEGRGLSPGDTTGPDPGTPSQDTVVRLENRVVVRAGAPAAGAGLVLSGFVAVSPEGRISPETPTIADWRPTARPVLLQLGHAGRRGACRPPSVGVDVPLRDGWSLVSASPLPYGPFSAVPEELDENGMAAVRDDFVRAAGRAAELGVDILELDFAHGYLLASFLSPLSNRRADAYGEDRLRFPLQVLEAVRGAWSGVLGVRLSVTDWARGGLSVDEGIAVARTLGEHSCDLVHVVAGQTIAGDRPEYRRGFLTALGDRVRAEARVPTLVGGYLTTPDDVNTIVGAGRADLCIIDLPPSRLEGEAATVPEPVEVQAATPS